MSIGLIGKKAGMSRLFEEDGTSIAVTVISVAGNTVISVQNQQKCGYSSVTLSKNHFYKRKLNKPLNEFFKKTNVAPGNLQEFRVKEVEDFSIGQTIDASLFEEGDQLDITGKSKGKGYAGVIKRHNFRMQDATHGNSLSHRAHGSTGQCQTPGRVWKGKKMSGQMGNERKTIQNLKLVKTDIENNLLFVKGAVPGPTGSILKITKSVKYS